MKFAFLPKQMTSPPPFSPPSWWAQLWGGKTPGHLKHGRPGPDVEWTFKRQGLPWVLRLAWGSVEP